MKNLIFYIFHTKNFGSEDGLVPVKTRLPEHIKRKLDDNRPQLVDIHIYHELN